MGCTRICLDKKSDVLDYIYSISNNVMINNLISDLINRDGVTNFFMNDDGSYSFSLVNEKHEKAHILFSDNEIFVNNNFDGIRQQVFYQIDDEGKYISVNNFSSIESHDNCIDRNVKVEKKYDCFDNLLYESKIVETKDLNNDSYENSCSIISKYYIDGQCIRVNSVSYDNDSSMNKTNYYISDGDQWINISENEACSKFDNKISKKVLQKQKSVL